MCQEKPNLIIEPREYFFYNDKLHNDGGIRWLYFLKQHIERKWHGKNNKIVHYDERYSVELIGGSRCGDDLETAKQQACHLMQERGFNDYDIDIDFREKKGGDSNVQA